VAGWPLFLISALRSSSIAMNWFPLLSLLLALSSVFWEGPGPPTERAADRGPQEVPDSLLASVREEYRVGRYWHGVELLRRALKGGSLEDDDVVLLLVRGEVGWRHWIAVKDLLQARLGKGEMGGPLPWLFLGMAQEETGDFHGAEEAYSRVLEALLEGVEGGANVDAVEVRIRRSRARMGTGSFAGALEDVGAVLQEDSVRGRWLALELARQAAEGGAPETTLALLAGVTPSEVRHRGWDLPPRALLASGDSMGAEGAFWRALPTLASGSERGLAWERVGVLRLARKDSLGARAAFRQVLLEDPRGGLAVEAGSALLELGFDSASVALQGAEALVRGGRGREALGAYEAYVRLRGGAVPRDVFLARARIHISLREPRAALALMDSLGGEVEETISAPALVLRAQALGALGRSSAARAVEDSLVAGFPDRPESAEILFLRANALQDRGDLEGAIRGFEATAALSPSQNLAGQARMRLGQIHLSQGRDEEAVRVFRDYLETFPDGRRWDEAAFWAGRTLLSQGHEAEARDLLDRLRARFPLSYYSVQSGALLGLPYEPGIPEPESPPPFPEFIAVGLRRIDALRQVGLKEGAGWELERLTDTIRTVEDPAERSDLLLRLALELNERGLTREGINLGWEIQRLGRAWDRDLLSAVYPFPYREMVLREAQEEGLDPFLMAGLMRQESAFWNEARSRADARGLMQVLPATGRELARVRGPRGFEAEEHLYRPEINLHLGMSFFDDLRRRFGEDLSILLSAYNAGPSRARRWREYPEAGDLPRFVERIPFAETRGYVKNVLLNREVYAWLYGSLGGEA
jgi:soluble lytic murein transglycosylase